MLRTRILPGLLRAVATNQARGLTDVALFEIGRVFLAPRRAGKAGRKGGDALLPDEPTHVAGVLAGSVRRRPIEPDRPVDGYDALDAVRTVLDALAVDRHRLVATDRPGFTSGRVSAVEVTTSSGDWVEIGTVGELDPAVGAAAGVESGVAAFELDVDQLLDAPRRDRTFVTPSPYPPATIDLAFVLPETVTAAAVLGTVRATVGDLLEDGRVFDEFRAESLGEGNRSLAFALRLRAPDRTLTDVEVGELRQQAIDAVVKGHGAQLRG